MDTETKRQLKERFQSVREKINAASDGREVTLLAATKTVSAETVNFAVKEFGLRYIGENKVQELIEKYPLLDRENIKIHFIGGLQTNKVRQIVDKVDMIESLDSLRLAKEIDKRASAIGKVMPVLVEINIGREPEKGGILPEDAESFIREAAKFGGIRISGLMTMAPAGSTDSEYGQYFSEVRELRDRIRDLNIEGASMDVLSMGMSESYEVAARCGASLVRVGSALFGKRSYPCVPTDVSPQ